MARNFPPRPQRGAAQQGASPKGAPSEGASAENAPAEGVPPAYYPPATGQYSAPANSNPAVVSPYAPGGSPSAPEFSLTDSSLAEWPAAVLPQSYESLPALYQRPIDHVLAAEESQAPSLPIILVSAAAGMIAGVSTYFILQHLLSMRLEWSVAASVLALCFGLGGTGAILSAATGSRAAVPNILFSCGVILLAGLFLGLCMVAGALGATLTLFLQG